MHTAVKKLLIASLSCLLSLSFAQTATLTLDQAIASAINSNYDIKKQQYAVAQAEAQLRQAKGQLDIEFGANLQYSGTNRPVDRQDPNYSYGYSFSNPDNPSGIYLDNTYLQQMNGSVYLKKLFSFGLETKVSYTIKRERNQPDYKYSKYYDLDKYHQEKARNTGDINLELSLPLFKSFRNSVVGLQLDSAKATLEQMKSLLQDSISQALIQTSKDYWQYYMELDNLRQLEILQAKAEKRYSNAKELRAAGMRSNTDLLSLQINRMENLRDIENARVKCSEAKMKLLQDMGINDSIELGEPVFDSFMPDESVKFPAAEDITAGTIEKIAEARLDITALKLKAEAAHKKLGIAKADAMPDANLKFNVGTTGAKYSDKIIDSASSPFWNIRGLNVGGSLDVSIKLGNNAKGGTIDQNTAEYNTALNEYSKAMNVLYTQVRNSVESMEVYRKNLKNADEILQLQSKMYENQEYLFSSNFINADKLIEEDQKFMRAKQNYYKVLVDYMSGVLEYKRLTASMLEVGVE